MLSFILEYVLKEKVNISFEFNIIFILVKFVCVVVLLVGLIMLDLLMVKGLVKGSFWFIRLELYYFIM